MANNDGSSCNMREGGQLGHHPNVPKSRSSAVGIRSNPGATSTKRKSAAQVTKNIVNRPVSRQTSSNTYFVDKPQFARDHGGKVDRGTQTEEQFMGNHPNLSAASKSVSAGTGPDPVTLTGSKTTTSSRNRKAGSATKKIAHPPGVRIRTKLVAEIGLDPSTLKSTSGTSSHNMAAEASEKINNVPVTRRSSVSKPRGSPRPLLLNSNPSQQVLDHIRQLAAKIKDYEVPESGGLQVELMQVVVGEIADTAASDRNVMEDEHIEVHVNQHNQRVIVATNPPSQPDSKTNKRKSIVPRRTLGNAFM